MDGGDTVSHQAQWDRFLRTSGVSNWDALTPEVQAGLRVQFSGWSRRQHTTNTTVRAAIISLVVLAMFLGLVFFLKTAVL
jgi:hypothetical protein